MFTADIMAGMAQKNGPDDESGPLDMEIVSLSLLDRGLAAAVGEVCHGGCHVDGSEGTDNHTEEHRKGERADCVATEDEDAQQHEQGRA